MAPNTPKPSFTAVICENIERSGRDRFDALRLERELRKAGIPVFATDEPIDTAAPEASTILVRRVKQGMAEYFRYNVKAQLWEGLKQYVAAGYNTGICPYGYLEERTPHPNPMKRNMGATRARLIPDPERGPWVSRMFEWRVWKRLDCNGIARRLIDMGTPPPRSGGAWGYQSVYAILQNPKYTGRVVLGRRKNTGPSQRTGEKRMVAVPREHWTWAADGNEHPALTSMELWEAAQEMGRRRGSVADHTAKPAGRNLYPLRGRITCAQCHRRMCGLTQPPRTYYVCSHNPTTRVMPQPHQAGTSAPHSVTPPSTTRLTASSARCSTATGPPPTPPRSPPPRPHKTRSPTPGPRGSARPSPRPTPPSAD